MSSQDFMNRSELDTLDYQVDHQGDHQSDYQSDYQSRTQRHILAAFGQRTLAFPDRFVEEITLVERSSILPLPFFVPALIGLAHSQGRLVPLLSLARLLKDANALIPEILTVVCVKSDPANPAVDEIAGAGLVVDRVVGSVTQVGAASYFQFEELLAQIPSHIWQPKRWY
ncbi:MAG: chemotaxis protein CheW [Pseudanabaenaceae cyanobacterium bins.68]|nr:chemotaxis protein CheW [Pseudanabaenaceae cyanobacterium bins.68]